MKFIGTKSLSPVSNLTDIPHDKDIFWVSPKEVPYKSKKDLESFVRKFTPDKIFWERQRLRCLNGYTIHNAVDFSAHGDSFVDGMNMEVKPDGSRYIKHLDFTIPANGDLHISGRHYFYLNFWKMSIEDKLAHSKTFGHPWFTDLSWENWMLRERARREFKDICFPKTRQRALSSEESCDFAWIWFFMNNVQGAITSGVDVYNDQTFLMVKNGVKTLSNTAFFKTIEYDNDDKFTTKNTGVEIFNRTANGNAEVLNGLNKLYKVQIEEFVIMQEELARQIVKNVRPSITTGGDRRTGFIVLTGTSGKKDEKGKATVNNMKDLEEFTYNPVENGLLEIENFYDKKSEGDEKKVIACFVPAWKFRKMDEDGNSLKQESIDSWKQDIALKNKRDQAAYMQLEPMETTDMFNIIPGGFFGDEISDRCNRARNEIIAHKYRQAIELGFLKWKNPHNPTAGAEFKPDEDGDIFILAGEHPRMKSTQLPGGKEKEEPIEDLYLQGTDSYDFEEAVTSDSKLCSLIFKMVDKSKGIYNPEMGVMNNLVAGYIGRPTDKEGGSREAYENAAKLSVYYHVWNMIEYTKIRIFDAYTDWGLEGFLAPRPDLVVVANIEKSLVSNKYGMPSSLISPMLGKLKDWLKADESVKNIPFEFVLKAIASFKRTKHYNCDITMAFVCIMAQLDEFTIQEEENQKKESQPQGNYKGYYKMVGGNLVEV